MSQGQSAAQAAALVGLDASYVRRLIRRYNAGGPASVADATPAAPRRA